MEKCVKFKEAVVDYCVACDWFISHKGPRITELYKGEHTFYL